MQGREGLTVEPTDDDVVFGGGGNQKVGTLPGYHRKAFILNDFWPARWEIPEWAVLKNFWGRVRPKEYADLRSFGTRRVL